MNIKFKEIVINTKRRREIVNITEEIQKFVNESKINNGICLVYSTHATSAIIINENESGLLEDIIRKINEDYPIEKGWLHNRIDDNADAHLASTFIGPSVTIPIKDGKLCLGTWQDIFFLELDGPRIGRKIIIEVLGV
ncbi:MAG: YjbQ family protein [Candidatus Methanomethylicota archaeon]|uniref:YjbQ family protein n=1 Tax=Thermoproteota archaeon TaxID=2056631 RepID=A0A523BA75_9CREN|nr:MAG: YjbQ family protein [Candidatus Verstraetearchaeota archaeon]TDA37831.1 MAG: YjbQ family protein [Candidatus Verstraetearchaeota archaeon]